MLLTFLRKKSSKSAAEALTYCTLHPIVMSSVAVVTSTDSADSTLKNAPRQAHPLKLLPLTEFVWLKWVLAMSTHYSWQKMVMCMLGEAILICNLALVTTLSGLKHLYMCKLLNIRKLSVLNQASTQQQSMIKASFTSGVAASGERHLFHSRSWLSRTQSSTSALVET